MKEYKEVLSNILLYSGMVAATIGGLDKVLSQKAKKKLKDWLELAWIWLEYKKLINFYRVDSNAKRIVLANFIIVIFIIYLITFQEVQESYNLTFIESLMLIPIIVFFCITANFTSGFVFYKGTLFGDFYTRCYTYIFSSKSIMEMFDRVFQMSFNIKAIVISYVVTHFFILINLPFLLPFLFMRLIILSYMILTVPIWGFVAAILKRFLLIASWLVYKMTSFSNGALAGVSSLLTATGAFLKWFTL